MRPSADSGRMEQYFPVREILAEASSVADAFLSRERSDFYRFGFAALGLTSFHPEIKDFRLELSVFSRQHSALIRFHRGTTQCHSEPSEESLLTLLAMRFFVVPPFAGLLRMTS
jgi:hypothetical protein